MTTFNFREPGEFGDGATMTESNVSPERLQEMLDAEIPLDMSVVDAREIITLALEALALRTPSGGVKVKPLEWAAFKQDWHSFSTVGGYSVGLVRDDWVAVLRHYLDGEDIDEVVSRLGTVEAAKAAAQADYEQRILSALTLGKE